MSWNDGGFRRMSSRELVDHRPGAGHRGGLDRHHAAGVAMSRTIELHCDRCGFSELYDPQSKYRAQTGWADISVGLHTYDICPACWAMMVEHAELKSKGEQP